MSETYPIVRRSIGSELAGPSRTAAAAAVPAELEVLRRAVAAGDPAAFRLIADLLERAAGPARVGASDLLRLLGPRTARDDAPPAPAVDEEPAPVRPAERPSAAASADRRRFLTDVRRIWMHSSFKARPYAILIASARVASAAARPEPGAGTGLAIQRRVRDALEAGFAQVTEVYAFDSATLAMVLPGLNLRQGVAVAEATRRTLEKQAIAEPGGGGLVFSAGLAALHRDDDPTSAVCLAERCLAIARESPVGKVVCETDPEARLAPRPRAVAG